jgi:hypothetical protein
MSTNKTPLRCIEANVASSGTASSPALKNISEGGVKIIKEIDFSEVEKKYYSSVCSTLLEDKSIDTLTLDDAVALLVILEQSMEKVHGNHYLYGKFILILLADVMCGHRKKLSVIEAIISQIDNHRDIIRTGNSSIRTNALKAAISKFKDIVSDATKFVDSFKNARR